MCGLLRRFYFMSLFGLFLCNKDRRVKRNDNDLWAYKK